MKQFFLTTFTFLLVVSSFANKITGTAISSSDWATTSTWNTNRLPNNYDTIVIPAGITIVIQNPISLNNVILQISGTLDMNNGKLFLDNASRVLVYSGGKILSESNSDQIAIGGVRKFKGNGQNNSVSGPSFADASTGTAPNGFVMDATLPVISQAFMFPGPITISL